MYRALLSLFLFISIQSSFSQIAKGDRILAYQVDMSENGNYDSAFYYANSACAESVHLFNTWSSIETDAGVFDPIGYSILDITNIYYPAYNMPVEMQLAPINTVAKTVPEDLIDVDFDDIIMINRFKVFLDTFFAHTPDLKLSALNIGNEHDVYFADDPAQYDAYKTFLDSIVPYAKTKYFSLHGEELKVGTTFTFDGLTDPSSAALCQGVNDGLDVVTLTYYPLEPDFTMENPTVVFDDFDAIVSLYSDPAQPIYFAECGYSSSEICNSSESLQADFYSNVFEAWDEHYDNIKYLTIFKTTDWSQAEVDTLAVYYGVATEEFKEYLRALGVRTFPGDGSDKIAYDRIKCLLDERSWCSPLNCIGVGLEDAAFEQLELYPNPVQSLLSISIPSQLIEREANILITDMNGRIILSSEEILQNGIQLDISVLSDGVYLLRLECSDGTLQSKFVKG